MSEDGETDKDSDFPIDSVTLGDLVSGLNLPSEGQELERVVANELTEGADRMRGVHFGGEETMYTA